jgi:hypothetical protein
MEIMKWSYGFAGILLSTLAYASGITSAPATIWAVVTTVHYPTEALKKLNSMNNVHLVVVADKKTPLDWHLEGCDFLSVEKQLALGYKIIPLLPWNHYSRKNIGYLYAIEHGAKIIYDTDDDNIIIGNSIEYLPTTTSILSPVTQAIAINPYAYFGQDTVWPRGYPLELVMQEQPITLQHDMFRPLIQQGLVNNDPDVDAIFRLTRKLPIYFTDKAPICLRHGTMAPFNTQNTLFHYKAFWGLLVPVTPNFRVCDIWRGHWVQRILWDIQAHLCFMPARVVQERNVHNYLHDFIDETDLYTKAGKLVNFLCTWHATSTKLFDRILELHTALIDANFFKPEELAITKAWLEDLQAIGYGDLY